MRKSTLIANCLVNTGMTLSILSGEREVERVFRSHFIDEDFGWWNGHIGDKTAKRLIGRVGQATKIHVAELITELWADE